MQKMIVMILHIYISRTDKEEYVDNIKDINNINIDDKCRDNN